jgi:metal-dependent amidase/aminoacylase/carboxypeptidase family protein
MTQPCVLSGIAALEEEMIALRRLLHAHPELSFEDFATSDLVAAPLEEWGYEVHRGPGSTGVVGRLRQGSSNRVIGLGKFGFLPGPFMASTDTLTIPVQGVGGHGAMPHKVTGAILNGVTMVRETTGIRLD